MAPFTVSSEWASGSTLRDWPVCVGADDQLEVRGPVSPLALWRD